jgi:hypothetical protein
VTICYIFNNTAQGVFHYTRRLGYPVCYLRPVKEVEKKGHCHFAFPLYTTNKRQWHSEEAFGDGRSEESAGYDVYSPDKDCARVDARADNSLGSRGEEGKRELVSFAEYFQKSLARELKDDKSEALRTERGRYTEGTGCGDEEDAPEAECPEYDSGEDADGGSDESSAASSDSGLDWNGVINGAGRQALGCMLGMNHMPTLCQSYPVAPELSQADFWHVRRVFWRDRLREASGGEGGASVPSVAGRRLAPGWQKEEQYVVVHAPACEGFSAGEAGNSVETRHHLTPVRNGIYQSPDDDALLPAITIEEDGTESKQEPRHAAPPKSTPSIAQFLGDNLMERWEETQWFLAMIEDISAYLPMELLTNHAVTLVYVNRLAHIWYNFDALQSAKSRPYKTYRRLKRDIETLTWTLVKETRTFLESANCYTANSDSSDSAEHSYRKLLFRLNIA